MKKLTTVENLKKGYIITMIETHPVWNSETETFENVTSTHKFEIIRNNSKTYGCKYIEGAYKNSGFNWIKGHDLTGGNKEYYLN